MADMLVKLFNISAPVKEEEIFFENGIRFKRALAPDRNKIIEYSKTCGGEDYSAEVQAAFANNPITCYIATKDKELIGFACFEATAKNFFGPMAVSSEYRKQGIGKMLLLKSLYSMQEMGYGYAIIGWPTKSAIPFYEKCVGATMIEDGSLGIYRRMINVD